MKAKVFAAVAVLGAAWLLYAWLKPPYVRNADPRGDNIVCFGDSLTYGTGASPGMDYPSQLRRLVSLPVINAGVPGDTAAEALERLEEDVLERSPRMVLITLGGNDLKNGASKEEAFENLRLIVERIQEAGALVVLGGIRFMVWDRGFGDAYEELAESTGSVLVDNVFEGVMGNAALMSDPIHPNDKGYAVFARRFHEALEPYL